MKVKEVIVVEGKDDTAKVLQAVHADTIETNGSAINSCILKQIQHAKEKRGVIIFTDPDYPGQRIRHIVDQAIPGCKHAFLTRDQARNKRSTTKSLGIEHASVADIKQALAAVYELQPVRESEITKADLIHYGFIGGLEANKRREQLGELLQIGHTNGKQLLKRLTMFGIGKAELKRAVMQIGRERKAKNDQS
ncbi:ribonuclease M5 [Virgibacillus pantothenticus]|uniref:ribonuclease M5 n=1 Tax=Virgibacillus pantothenticus TaxID=1473 RepID=UPI0009878D2D|nr:ribonuclease M5 [Virgibacillus pantothenticus]